MRRGSGGFLRRRHRDERGYSMGELVVTMTVASLALSGAGTVVLSLSRGAHTLNTAADSSADVRIALEAVSRMLRVAARPPGEPAAIVSARPDSMSFYALVDRTNGGTPPPPVLLTYSWDGTCLSQSRTAGRRLPVVSASGSLYAWDAAPAVTCLLRTTTAPDFTYSATGELTPAGDDPTPLPIPAGGLPLLDRQSVQSVGVRVAGPTSPQEPVMAASTRVTLQNVVAEAGTW